MNHSQVADKYQVHSTMIQTHYFSYSIDDVIVNMLSSSVVDRGFEPLSGQAKDYKIGICCFSAKHAALREKSTGWLARKQICVRVGRHVYSQTVVSVSLHYKNKTKHFGLVQSRTHHYHLIEN